MTSGGPPAAATLRPPATEPQALLAAVLDAVPDAAVVTDAAGTIAALNGAAEVLFAQPAGRLLGTPLEPLLTGRQRGRGLVRRPGDLDGPPLALHAVRPAGPVPVEARSRALHLGAQELTCIVLRDVSAQQAVEEELRDSLEQLERSLAERRKLLGAIVRAQEEERARIAADMHDDTIQAITAVHIRLQIEAARTAEPDRREALDALQEQVGGALGRLRRLTFELRPPALDRHGLRAAVAEQLERMRTEEGIEWQLAHELDHDPPADVGVVLFRVAKEALTNVVRHARATAVAVALSARDDGYELSVADDGVGPGDGMLRARPGHLGLATMRERVEAAGGRLTAGPGEDGGTRICVWVPGERRRRPRPEGDIAL